MSESDVFYLTIDQIFWKKGVLRIVVTRVPVIDLVLRFVVLFIEKSLTHISS